MTFRLYELQDARDCPRVEENPDVICVRSVCNLAQDLQDVLVGEVPRVHDVSDEVNYCFEFSTSSKSFEFSLKIQGTRLVQNSCEHYFHLGILNEFFLPA